MNYFSLFLQVEPILETAINFAESAARKSVAQGNTVTGADKLNGALAIVQSAYNQTNPSVPFEQVSDSVKTIINVAVAVYNAIGAFGKKTA